MQKIIFLGSKPIGYYCLEFLIAQQNNFNYQIVGVLSKENKNFDTNFSVFSLAKSNNISIINSLDEIPNVDILISVQYHQILKPIHIQKAKIAFNLHMAPLPEYRGCNQFSFALIDNKEIFGTTIHKIDSKIDNGDIAFESRFEIPENCWVNDLYNLTEEKSIELFKKSLEKIIKNNIQWQSQQSLITERGTSLHFRNEINNLKQIDLSWDTEKIERHIRATYMPGFEPPYTFLKNKKIYFNLEKTNA